ncbi:MAG: GNAT family N-acetyltransferase [Acidobacteria bacterium]|nr:GNAT family N-acetyltransferase [Acidobacteriota bacterium]
MEISVHFYEDVRLFAAAVEDFLRSRAVVHNLILTIVDGRVARPEPGRYWVATRGGQVVGVALQSPLHYPATVVPMERDVTAAIVDAIVDAGLYLPGVNGEAATAASFAGRWTERRKSAAFPKQGLRLYELIDVQEIAPVEGELRRAGVGNREFAVGWLQEFYVETGAPASSAVSVIDAALSSESVWLWQHGGTAVSMALTSKPIQGVVRISGVYTPREHRRRGYAGACVCEISKQLVSAGHRCMLYTDLGNPTSNSVYRRIGYEAVAEGIDYRFDAEGGSDG